MYQQKKKKTLSTLLLIKKTYLNDISKWHKQGKNMFASIPNGIAATMKATRSYHPYIAHSITLKTTHTKKSDVYTNNSKF